MDLTEEQKDIVKQLYRAKGDVFEAVIVERLVDRGIPEDEARRAARECSNRIWRNSMTSGALTGVLIGTVFTPVVGAFAGSSMAAFVGYQTLLTSNACRDVRDWDLNLAIQRLNSGL